MVAALAVFTALFSLHSGGVAGYLLSRPFPVDALSIRLWASRGIGPLGLAAAAWLIALGAGRNALARLGLRPAGAAGTATAAALGLGLFAQAAFMLACAGLLTPGAMLLLTAAGAALSVRRLRRLALPRPPQWSAPEGVAAGLLAYAAACAALTALAPAVEWDVRAYHLALPELYLKAGGLVDVPWMIHSHWPRLMETFYAWPLAAGSDGAAALVHTGAALLLVAGVAASAGRGPAGWTAALLLAGQPALLRVAGTAHSDAAAALFVFAAAYCLSRWEERRLESWLIAAGALAGCAASAKLLGTAALGAWTLALLWKTRRPREAAVFAACGAALLAPWLWTTWSATGDPVWPFLGRERDAAELAARYLRSNRWDFPPPASWFAHDGPAFLLLPALGLLALGGRRTPAGRLERWLWLAAPAYAALAWRHNEAWRFLMPVWAAFALAAARAAAGAFAAGGARRAAAATLVIAAAWPIVALSPNNALFAVLGLRSAAAPGAERRALFLERSVDVAAFYRETRAALPSGAKVLLFRETRGYEAGFDYVWGDPKNQALLDYRAVADPGELVRRLKSLGITHVLDHPGSHLYQEDPGYYDARTLGLMSAALARSARPVLERDGLALYELK